jgi:uncharacterized protein DUF6152
MKVIFLSGLMAGLIALMCGVAYAHHGWSQYDMNVTLDLSGTIKEAGYENPHGYVILATSEKEWRVVLAPPSRLALRGVSPEMLKPGAKMSVVGHPNRNKLEEMRAERIVINGKTYEMRAELSDPAGAVAAAR